MPDTTDIMFNPDAAPSLNYRNIVTHLGEFLATNTSECAEEFDRYSIFKDLDQVKKRYQNPVLIGKGGMKKIFRVFDRMMDREVALAIIHGLIGGSLIEQFIMEARITAKLEHPCIMPIYDFGLDEKGEPFFTMKLVNGETLANIITELKKENPEYIRLYPLDALLEIFVKICDAVAYAHHRGILHLDLKPDNVQIGAFGEVLVCDWGLSRYFGANASSEDLESKNAYSGVLTHKGGLSGTPCYMSPEQIQKPRHQLTLVSDIYSLGVILYEILTYRLPIKSGSVKQMISDTLHHRILPMRSIVPKKNIPLSLEAVCKKAMSRDPDERYSDAAEIKADIFAYHRGYPTKAEKAGLARNLLLLISRYKFLFSTIVAAIIVIVVIAVLSFVSISEKKIEAELQKQEAEKRLAELIQLKREAVAPIRQQQAEVQYHLFRFEEARKLLSEAFLFDPENASINRLRGFLYLGEGNYQEALRGFLNADYPELRKYIKICEDFLHMRLGANIPLPEKNLFELLKMLSEDGNESTIAQLIAGEASKIPDLSDKLLFAHKILFTLNPSAGIIKMDCVIDSLARSVDISLQGNELLEDITGLVFLPVSSLDISNTRVSSLYSVGQLPLVEFNLANTPVTTLKPLDGSTVKSLDISSTDVISLEGVSLPYLKRLVMKDVRVEELSWLFDFPALRELVLSDNIYFRGLTESAELPEGLKVVFIP